MYKNDYGHKGVQYHFISGLLLCLSVSISHAAGQSSSNYTISWDVIDIGAPTVTSTNYILTSSMGQTSSSQHNHTNYVLTAGFQATLDQDNDSVRNVVDNCTAIANSDQVDTDADTYGDACDAFQIDPSEWLDTDLDGIGNNTDIDDDNDGLFDIEEISLGSDPLLTDTDGDGYDDNIEVAAGTDPLDNASYPVILVDGDINLDGIVDVRDILLGTQVLLGTVTLDPEQFIHADVAPLVSGSPDPDGFFNAGDLLVIQRKALGLISF